jgi:microcystin degradation protein MlrC
MLGGLDRSYGTTAVLRVEGVDILIVTEREQMLDRQQLLAFGIDPASRKTLALKSMQHFRAAFEPIAGKVIVCDSGALSTPQMARRPYRRVTRPIWPLDADATYPV